MADGRSRVFHPAVPQKGRALLIVGEQVQANGLRAALTLAGRRGPIAVASLFGLDQDLALPGDLALEGEDQLLNLIRTGDYSGIIADPLITGLPAAQGLWRGQWVHPAVSSSLYWDQAPPLLGENTDTLVGRWAEEGG